MKLDWDLPAYSPANDSAGEKPMQVEVVVKQGAARKYMLESRAVKEPRKK